jgi:hypothetical protein
MKVSLEERKRLGAMRMRNGGAMAMVMAKRPVLASWSVRSVARFDSKTRCVTAGPRSQVPELNFPLCVRKFEIFTFDLIHGCQPPPGIHFPTALQKAEELRMNLGMAFWHHFPKSPKSF